MDARVCVRSGWREWDRWQAEEALALLEILSGGAANGAIKTESLRDKLKSLGVQIGTRHIQKPETPSETHTYRNGDPRRKSRKPFRQHLCR